MGFLVKLTLAVTLVICATAAVEDSEIITAPRPGEEYVYVQSGSSNARPITRKEKKAASLEKTEEFESSHKIPTDLKYAPKDSDKVKRAAEPQQVPGAIKIDPLKLLEQYKDVLATSTTQRSTDSTTTNVVLTTGSTVTKRSLDVQGLRDSDAKLKSSGSEKSTSRIQVKKGPNGQDYEYEYVYYYYDEEEEKPSNAHDGPARNSITPSKNKYTSIDRVSTEKPLEAASNEVVPQRSRSRARSDELTEERLPANTRFPPRSRNLGSSTTTTSTAAPEEEKKRITRPRGRPTAAAPQETSEETPARRSRPNIKRPSLELVDSASFKTHASDVSVSQYKDLPAREESATARSYDTAEPNKAQSLDNEKAKASESDEKSSTQSESSTVDNTITTTLADDMTAAMDKVALDLYAILQGTQNMIEDGESQGSTDSSDASGTTESSTDEVSSTTEPITEEATTPSTTTTTTTTTQATTTTTTTEAVTPALPGKGRFRGRPTNNRFRTTGGASTTTTEATAEVAASKAPSRFSPPGRNSFGGRNRVNPRTTTTTEKTSPSAEGEVVKSEVSPSHAAKPAVGNRSRFGSRGRTSSTTAAEDSAAVSAATPKPTLVRPRPSYNLNRRRGGAAEVSSTAKSTESEEETGTEASSSAEVSSTVAPRAGVRPRVTPSQVRPLRPGPKINIAPRGRLGTSPTTTTSTTSSPVEGETSSEASSEVESTTSGPSTTENALQRLRHRSRIAAPAVTQKPKAASPTPIARRANPLIGNRRKPTTEATTPTTEEAPAAAELQNEVVTESAEEVHVEPSEEPISSTTEAARGLNGLLAGRRRVNRRPGTIL